MRHSRAEPGAQVMLEDTAENIVLIDLNVFIDVIGF